MLRLMLRLLLGLTLQLLQLLLWLGINRVERSWEDCRCSTFSRVLGIDGLPILINVRFFTIWVSAHSLNGFPLFLAQDDEVEASR